MDRDRPESKVTLSELEFFVQLRMWKVVVEDALSSALIASEENDVLDPIQEPSKISRNQGKIEALKWVVDLPRIMREQLELERREEKEKDGRERKEDRD